MLRISVVVCTRNRAARLREALTSLIEQSLPAEEYEVIVADNGSSDDTREVAADFAETYSNVQYILVREPGTSNARNAALARARAPYVAYMDDDAVADRYCLEELLNAFGGVKPSPACIGGRVRPLWETPPPDWLPPKFIPSLSVLDREDSRHLQNTEWVVGANIAFDRAELEAAGGWDPRFTLYADEVYVQWRLRRQGHHIYYHSAAVVHHLVPAGRLTRRYMSRRKFLGGRAEFLFASSGRSLRKRILFTAHNIVGRPFDIISLTVRFLMYSASGNERSAAYSLLLLSRSTGIFVESVRTAARALGATVRKGRVQRHRLSELKAGR